MIYEEMDLFMVTAAGSQLPLSSGRWYRFIHQLRETWEARVDPLRLRRRFPELAKFDREFRELNDKLKLPYEEYVATISTPDSAISLELSVLILILCQIRRPRRILDLGSGFSSWVFRFYQAQAQPASEIWSVDDDPHWLEQTRQFLSTHRFSVSHLESWHDFTEANHAPFDFILHDLGSMTLRQTALPQVIALAAHRGLVLLDDMQKQPYGPYARQLVRNLYLETYNLKFLVRDRFRRYAFLVLT